MIQLLLQLILSVKIFVEMKTSTLVFISVSNKIKKIEMLHKYIPVQYNRLYYVYDCMDGSLYPCYKNVYFAFRKYTFSELLEKYKNNNPEGSISNFIQMLLNNTALN